jgi:hypothetical protein
MQSELRIVGSNPTQQNKYFYILYSYFVEKCYTILGIKMSCPDQHIIEISLHLLFGYEFKHGLL